MEGNQEQKSCGKQEALYLPQDFPDGDSKGPDVRLFGEQAIKQPFKKK